jgi:hypothetical protein
MYQRRLLRRRGSPFNLLLRQYPRAFLLFVTRLLVQDEVAAKWPIYHIFRLALWCDNREQLYRVFDRRLSAFSVAHCRSASPDRGDE